MLTVKRLVCVVAAVLALGAVATGASLWASGHRMYAVASGSMTPALGVGELVLTVPPTSTSVRTGDVITYPAPAGGRYGYTTHRVTGVDGTVLTTRGDANEKPDPSTVELTEVVGVVRAQIPHAGYVLVFFQHPAGLASVITGLFSLALLWDLFFPEEQGAAARPSTAPRTRRIRLLPSSSPVGAAASHAPVG